MPLTDSQIAIIKATVPLLETGGEALTKHFYGIMLNEYPVVVSYFNKAHQASGDQPRALANAVLMYAKNIETLEKLGSLVNQIVNKHVSLNIKLEHYSIVGSCLLRAIREVLGEEVATDDVIAAWAAAYEQLSTILSNAEQNVYDTVAAAEGGWRGDRNFVVQKKVDESSEITSFYLYPQDGKAILPYEAGKYIGLHITVDGEEMRRNYSLSSSSNGNYYRISVKKEDGGKVSTYLHDTIKEGDVLQLYPPAGDFILALDESGAPRRPVVFICGGVGITPCYAMLEDLLNRSSTSQNIYFVHVTKNKSVQAFKRDIEALAEKYSNLHYYSHYTRREEGAHDYLSSEALSKMLPSDNMFDAYFLGPFGFMKSIKDILLANGVEQSNLHWEFFGPNKNLM